MRELSIVYQRVGVTRSGKFIPYISDESQIALLIEFFQKDFSADHLLDLFAVYEYLALRAIRHGTADEIFEEHSLSIIALLSAADFEDAKQRANINSAFDLRDLGRALVSLEFVEL